MFKDRKIFISGGAGVIGRVLVECLHQQGAVIFVGDLKPRPAAWPADILYRQGDLNTIRKEELENFAPEYFFHLAATFERSEETPDFWQENMQHNVKLSHHLMDCLKDSASLQRVIFASSYLIYEPNLYFFKEPREQAYRLKETDPIYPRNLTGVAKLMHEVELRFLNEFSSFPVVSARIFRVYGKGSRDVISRWVRSLIQGEPIMVYGEENLFDFIFADEVAEGLVKLAESSADGVINLGRDSARPIKDVVAILQGHFPKMVLQKEDQDINYEASQANMEQFKEKVGWSPSVHLEDGIAELVAYERTQQEQGSLTDVEQGNILLSSLSAKIPMLASLRQAAQTLGADIKIYGADKDGACLGRNFTDDFWEMPDLQDLSLEDLISNCQSRNIQFWVPSRDGELEFLARHRDRLKQEGIAVMVSGLEAVDMCRDKLRFFEVLTEKGYPVIPTAVDIETLDASRYVLKDRLGAGSRHLYLDLSPEEVVKKQGAFESPVTQPYIEGQEFSLDTYVNREGCVMGVVCRSRDKVIQGESQISTVVRDEQLEDLIKDIAESFDFYGHLVFQGIRTADGHFYLIECNPRFGGASSLSLAHGLDSFYWFLLESLGEDMTKLPFVRCESKTRLVRFPRDLIQ